MGSMKKRLSLLGFVSLATIVGLSLTVGVAEAKKLKLEIDADETSFDFIESPMGQLAFHIKGTIVDGGTPIGTFRCWGWVLDDTFTNVNQIYSIDGRGAIMTQGVEFGPPSIAVTGGTGDFRDVRGEGFFGDPANPSPPMDSFDFSIEFKLKGARR